MYKLRTAFATLLLGLTILFSDKAGAQNLASNKKPLPQLGKSPIKEIISAMTLEEKVNFVVGNGFKMPGVTPQGPTIGQTKDKVPGAAGTTYAIPRLGIPGMVVSDGPAGVRIDPIRNQDSSITFYATAWPVGTLLASSWDTALVRKTGAAFGNEVHEYGIDVLLGPGMNIHRNPLGGRNFEYYSEDPLVSGRMAAALVNGIQSNGVGTSIKHFVANNQETDRNSVNSIVSERALREIYLKGFEIAVKESHPWTVMSSYNYLNGTYASQSHDLLTNILRNDWGYKGFVMTDWFGGNDPVAQMNAGNNLLMPGTPEQSKKIMAAVQSGKLSEKILDENIAGILNILVKSPAFKSYHFSNSPDLKKHAELSRMAAAEGMVLLKNNNNALPLTSNIHKIALFGIDGYDLIAGGTGSGDVNKAYTIPLDKGLSNAGFEVDPELKDVMKKYIAEEKIKHPKKSFIEEFMNPTPPIVEFAMDKQTISKKAAESDIAIIAIGRNAGEGHDRNLPGDYYLTETEKALIKNVSNAFHEQHKKIIIVLNIGGVIDVSEWRDDPDAILLAWQPGQEGGNAITDVLSGKVDPSGKLATSFPYHYNDVPSAKNFPGKEFPEKATTGALGMKLIPAEVIYEEGIYVGYRYYNSFHVKTAYEFGYGLSYSHFDYKSLKLSSTDFKNQITASVTITNTGKSAGKEVVQLYISAPAKKMDKPSEELKAFAKTKLLAPGQSQTLSFIIKASDLASFDSNTSSWVAEAGEYTLKIGASSLDIRQTKKFQLDKELVTGKTSKSLVPKIEINEMKNQ
ncbi:MAG: glycoside hydrolase family 3 C-terminal domain-containing protein [Bacteroidetes bacterium]|nr:glycoside hydrolase family 3 C-terminal domain-containing protein [Bacteroidota bacterium]